MNINSEKKSVINTIIKSKYSPDKSIMVLFSQINNNKQEAHGLHRSPVQKSPAVNNLKKNSLYQLLIEKKYQIKL